MLFHCAAIILISSEKILYLEMNKELKVKSNKYIILCAK